MLSVVNYCHNPPVEFKRAKIINYHLKTANIFMIDTKTIKISDFG
jgi:hypothetical protein